MIEDDRTELKREVTLLRKQIEDLTKAIEDLKIQKNQPVEQTSFKIGSRVELLSTGKIGKRGDIGTIHSIGKAFIFINLKNGEVAARKPKNLRITNHE